MDIADSQVLQHVWQILQKRQGGIFRVGDRDSRLFDFLIHFADCQTPPSFRLFQFKATDIEFGLMRQLSPLKLNPADFKLVFLPGQLLLLGSPLLGEAPFGFDSALFTLKAHCIAEWRLKIFKKLPRKNAHALDFDGLHGDPPESRHIGHFVLELPNDATALRNVSSIVMLATWCRMADSTTSWRAPPIVVKASSGSVKSKFAAAFSASATRHAAKPEISTP